MDLQLEPLDQAYLEKLNMVKAVASSDAGINFLRWLHRMSGFSRPTMNMEDATRRDFWLTLRPFIPVEKLGEIEHGDLRDQQSMALGMLEVMGQLEDDHE